MLYELSNYNALSWSQQCVTIAIERIIHISVVHVLHMLIY